ncbi:Wadjet anti-phage system protein JetD domain-containing protein [Methanosarcina sp. 2.H.A.1B.4]|uniref:Wadjet anti-phage system protein JetD domain-containing protein n=1 Tax=Methanosarcina sp. 2.H.A.1B.4 TaxID=1483600 RepID=UPI001F186BEB|nr:Wadjet anti-phage system protein JetD domain-containing protein [Methanosarcina sp. 2.H.A.1B.4]
MQEYKEHRPYILRISDLVSSRPAETLTANERAFELFGDEKALTSPEHAAFDGNAVLKNLELTLEDIGAEIVYEPFVYTRSKMFDTRDITPVRTILIVENKDTYWTLKNAVLHSDLDYIDMVIYGEGKAILSTFRYIEEVGGRVNDRYFYFGDLDREGIEIFNLFRKKYSEYEIVPAVKYYEYMINKVGVENAKAIRTHQKVKDYSSFIGYFSDTTGHNIKTIVENNLYIPQEAINKTDIKELRVIGLQ